MFTLIGLLTSFLWKGSRDTISILRSMDWRFLSAMFLLIFVDWVLMGYRVFIFAAKMSNRVGFWDCFRANLANTCVAAITPSQSGGWAGQLYILYRSGLPLAGGATITVITFLSTLLFFLFSALVVILFTSFTGAFGLRFAPQLYMGKMALLMRYCFIMFGLVLASFILLSLKPEVVFSILSKLSSFRFVKLNRRIYKFFQSGMTKLERFTSDYKKYTALFIKGEKGTVLLCVFITFILYFNKFVTAYVIARALENQTAFWDVIFVQVLLIFISYFSPTPGASGISEFSATLFMTPLMRQGAASCFTPIWRFSNTYSELFVGGVIIVAQLRRDFRDAKVEFDS